MNLIYILNLNFYLFKKKIFFNKIIYEKIFKQKKIFNIKNYYLDLKKALNYFNPFYGIKIDTLIDKIKKNFYNKKNKKKFFSKKNIIYKIPYKELSYIFNISIEKLRIKK